MEYKVYSMNSLSEGTAPHHIDGLIFFTTSEERSWNVATYFQDNKTIPNCVLAINLEGCQEYQNFQKEKFKNIILNIHKSSPIYLATY